MFLFFLTLLFIVFLSCLSQESPSVVPGRDLSKTQLLGGAGVLFGFYCPINGGLQFFLGGCSSTKCTLLVESWGGLEDTSYSNDPLVLSIFLHQGSFSSPQHLILPIKFSLSLICLFLPQPKQHSLSFSSAFLFSHTTSLNFYCYRFISVSLLCIPLFLALQIAKRLSF